MIFLNRLSNEDLNLHKKLLIDLMRWFCVFSGYSRIWSLCHRRNVHAGQLHPADQVPLLWGFQEWVWPHAIMCALIWRSLQNSICLLSETKRSYQMSSFVETKALEQLTKTPVEFVEHPLPEELKDECVLFCCSSVVTSHTTHISHQTHDRKPGQVHLLFMP